MARPCNWSAAGAAKCGCRGSWHVIHPAPARLLSRRAIRAATEDLIIQNRPCAALAPLSGRRASAVLVAIWVPIATVLAVRGITHVGRCCCGLVLRRPRVGLGSLLVRIAGVPLAICRAVRVRSQGLQPTALAIHLMTEGPGALSSRIVGLTNVLDHPSQLRGHINNAGRQTSDDRTACLSVGKSQLTLCARQLTLTCSGAGVQSGGACGETMRPEASRSITCGAYCESLPCKHVATEMALSELPKLLRLSTDPSTYSGAPS